MMQETEAIRKRIRERRLARGWSQRELAQHAGLAQVTISTIERGAYVPSLESLIRICRALDIDLGEIDAARGSHDRAC